MNPRLFLDLSIDPSSREFRRRGKPRPRRVGPVRVIFDIFDIPSQVEEEEESRGEIRNVELKEINWDDWRAPIFFSIR